MAELPVASKRAFRPLRCSLMVCFGCVRLLRTCIRIPALWVHIVDGTYVDLGGHSPQQGSPQLISILRASWGLAASHLLARLRKALLALLGHGERSSDEDK